MKDGDWLMTAKEVCEAFKITDRTLRRWRQERGFPKPLMINQRVKRYRRSDIDAWLDRETQYLMEDHEC